MNNNHKNINRNMTKKLVNNHKAGDKSTNKRPAKLFMFNKNEKETIKNTNKQLSNENSNAIVQVSRSIGKPAIL